MSVPRLHLARPKAIQDFPEWAKCCQAYIDNVQSEGEMLINLAVRLDEETTCSFCGADHGLTHGARDVADGEFTELELLEIDEKEFVQR